MYKIIIEIPKTYLSEDQISDVRAALTELDSRIGEVGSESSSAVKLGFDSETSADILDLEPAIESVLADFPGAGVSAIELGV